MKILKKSLAIALSTALCVSAVGDSNVFAQGGKKSKDKKGKSSTSRKKPLSEMEKKLSSGKDVELEKISDFEEFIRLIESGKYTTTDISISSKDFSDLFCFDDIFKRFLKIIENSKNIKKIHSRADYYMKSWRDHQLQILKDKQYDEGMKELFEVVLSNDFITDVSLLGFSRIVLSDGFYDVSLPFKVSFKANKEIIRKKVFDSNLIRKLEIESSYFQMPKNCNDLLMSFLGENTSISHFTLRGVKFSDLSSEIMKFLKDNTSLTQLSFNACDIKDEDLHVLVDFLRANSSITKLDLSHNMITSRGKALLDEAIASRPIKCDLILNENSVMTDNKIESLKKKISETHTVDFSDNIGDDEQFMNIVMDALDKKLFDKIIIGGKVEFTDCEQSFISLMKDKDLDVKRIQCLVYGFYDTICDIIKSCTRVQEIDFSNVGLCDDEVFCIADALKNNSTLKRLDLSENDISGYGAQVLLEALRENDTLTELELSDAPEFSNSGMELEEISEEIHNGIRKRLELNKVREDLKKSEVSPSAGEFSTYLSKIRSILENIKRLKLEPENFSSIMESIEKDVRELKDLYDVLVEKSRTYWKRYKYYEAVMKHLKDAYIKEYIDKKYIAKIYDDMSKEFNEYYSEYTAFLNDLKFIKVGIDDINKELYDINAVSGFFGYVNYFGCVRSFMERILNFKVEQYSNLSVKEIPKISSDEVFTEEDNAKIAKLKEQWSETWRVNACANVFYGCSNFIHKHYDDFLKKIRPDVSVKNLCRKDQEIWSWIYRIYLPVLEEAKEKKAYFSKDIRARVDSDSVYAKKAVDFVKNYENELLNMNEGYLHDVDLPYDFARRVRMLDAVDLYLSFLAQWDGYEKNEKLKPQLKLNMMVSNLNTLKDYIRDIKENCEELSGEAEGVERNIDVSLALLNQLFAGKDEAQLTEVLRSKKNLFNTEVTRKAISEILHKYKAIKDRRKAEAQNAKDKDDSASVTTVAEQVKPKAPKKKQKKQESKPCVVERMPAEEGNLMRMNRELESLKESLQSRKKNLEMLSEKHAQFLARGYLRVNKMGQSEEFAKKDNISRKLSDLSELFSDVDIFSNDDDINTLKSKLELLKRISDAICDKLKDTESLLSTAENFMSKKFEVPKVPCATSETEQENTKSSGEKSDKLVYPKIEFRNPQAEEEYRSYINDDREKMFLDKFNQYLAGNKCIDLKRITDMDIQFISCRYNDSGRICFTYDSDENCIKIIGVVHDHNYGMIRRRLRGCKA